MTAVYLPPYGLFEGTRQKVRVRVSVRVRAMVRVRVRVRVVSIRVRVRVRVRLELGLGLGFGLDMVRVNLDQSMIIHESVIENIWPVNEEVQQWPMARERSG